MGVHVFLSKEKRGGKRKEKSGSIAPQGSIPPLFTLSSFAQGPDGQDQLWDGDSDISNELSPDDDCDLARVSLLLLG